MDKITAIPAFACETDEHCYQVLRQAMEVARQSKYTMVAVAMCSVDNTWTRFEISKGGSHCEMAGTVKVLDHKIMSSWERQK